MEEPKPVLADAIVDTEEISTEKNDTPLSEEYAYIESGQFTSEAFKIEIGNLPKFFGFAECKKLLRNLNLKPHKISNIKRIRKAYVTFKSESDKIEAMEILQNYKYKNCVFRVKNAKPKSDAMAQKRSRDDENNSELKNKKSKLTESQDDLTPREILIGSVTKWHDIPYEEQLTKKHSQMKEFLCTFRQRIGKDNLDHEVFVWIMGQKHESEGQCCPLNPILPSPTYTKYRNKSEFTVGVSTLGVHTVGYRLGKYRDKTCAVEIADEIINLPDIMKSVASKFQEYVQTSGKDPYHPQTYKGHWRQLTVRTTLDGQVMAIIVVCKKNQSQAEITEEKESLRTFFNTGDSQLISTLLYQCVPTHRESGKEITPPEVLYGDGYITENLLGLKFQISPEAFFQCNTLAAEVLYSSIAKLLRASDPGEETKAEIKDEVKVYEETINSEKNIILFDICCGTGTIGITLAASVHRVVGIELCEQAVDDAKRNAEINGIKNAEFHCGKAEDLLPSLIKKYEAESNVEIVAIVDPPRPGLHSRVIHCLRRCALLQKIIYVSCNPNSAISNFIDLCRPISKRMLGLPFLPLVAQPVDLFPQTPHCELIIVFKRITGRSKNDETEETSEAIKIEKISPMDGAGEQ